MATVLQNRNARNGSHSAAMRYLWVFVFASMLVAWLLGDLELYRSDDEIGYNLGLAGGLMMLVLLTYPLSKRIRILNRLIPLRHWFRLHMVLGIAGPVLIMFHSNLSVESLNGGVAYYSMLAVFFSGLIGRFIYTHVHHGLYGRRASLDEFKQKLGLSTVEIHSKFRFSPRLDQLLLEYEKSHVTQSSIWFIALAKLMFHPVRFAWYYLRMRWQLRKDIRHVAEKKSMTRTKQRKAFCSYRKAMLKYMHTVDEVGQFHVYERLFSLWHYLHIPLLFLLIISAVIHVLAVHMY